jgi:hypothetical protein
MIMIDAETFLKIISVLFTLIAGLLAALWAYTKYILERGFLPPVNFTVTGKKVGVVDNKYIIDIKIKLSNIGSTTLIARNIRLDLLYITEKDKDIDILREEGKVGRLDFPHKIKQLWKIDPSDLIPEKIRKDEEKLDIWRQQRQRGFLVSEHDTFVQAGVDQIYTFVTLLPKETVCFQAHSSFQYAQRLSDWQNKISRLSRKLGLIQYTLAHATYPHTVEEVVWIENEGQPKQ